MFSLKTNKRNCKLIYVVINRNAAILHINFVFMYPF